MTIELQFITGGIVAIVSIAVLLWVLFVKYRAARKLNISNASLSSEELQDHAKMIAKGHSFFERQNFRDWPVPRMNENYDFILSTYKSLSRNIERKSTMPPAAEWLLDNFYIVEEQVKGLRRDLTRKSYFRLPVLKTGYLKGYSRIFAVAVELVAHTDGQINERILSEYLASYQCHTILFDRELWSLPSVMRLVLIEKIRHLCEDIKRTQIQWRKADFLFTDWMTDEKPNAKLVMSLYRNRLKTLEDEDYPFIEHLVYNLRRSGRRYSKVLRAIDKRLAKFGETYESIAQKEHHSQSLITVSMGHCFSSLRMFSTLDWTDLFESASFVHQILLKDPDGTYARMDSFSRSYYRQTIEDLASDYGALETEIAKEAIELAKNRGSLRHPEYIDQALLQHIFHVGHYLIGKGLPDLISLQKKRNRILPKAAEITSRFAGWLYLSSITLVTLLLVYAAVFYSTTFSSAGTFLVTLLTIIAVLVPSSEISVNMINLIVCKALKPAVFPRLELKDGIPKSMSTIIVVPTLLPDERRVKELLDTLENHYLSNRESNLYFVLVGAFKDSDKPHTKDESLIIEASIRGVRDLNSKYCSGATDKFYFFHRHSLYNEKNKKWFGWERKRGALMEFNDLVLGSCDTSFTYFSCESPPFSDVRYIITLDCDTILPMGMARKMIGTMAHPLHRPLLDKENKIVLDGYGIMQPRVDVDLESSSKSLFSSVYTGQEGIDPYANAISDVYQDLFGEGIYTGKGIYDLKVFQSVLKNTFPENSILSHDLLEGSYLRTALVSDLKVIDSHPSKYNSYASRQHRWTRGDWQLLPLLFGKIANNCCAKIPNPLSLLSRWKIFDNLRRSLVSPSLIVLAALGVSLLPGSVYFWLGFFILAQSFTFIMSVSKYLLSKRFRNGKTKSYLPMMSGLKAALFQGLLTFVFLPHQAWLMLHAICVTLVRVFVTKRNLLEWVTSADIEKGQKNSLASYLLLMLPALMEAAIILGLAIFINPSAVIFAIILFLIWASSPFIAFEISKDLPAPPSHLTNDVRIDLGRISRKTWRYFEEFTNTKNHYLVSDNYQADPPKGAVYRTSPTNIGLGLLSTLSARDFGYIGSFELYQLIERTVSSIDQLKKWNGHLYNWYDTATLKPLHPAYISTVDSGNLAGYLITLKQGMDSYLHSPLADASFLSGIKDTLSCAGKDGEAACISLALLKNDEEDGFMDLALWSKGLDNAINCCEELKISKSVWKNKLFHMLNMLKNEITMFMPVVDYLNKLPELFQTPCPDARVSEIFNELKGLLMLNLDLADLPAVQLQTSDCAERLAASLSESTLAGRDEALLWVAEMAQALQTSAANVKQFIGKYCVLLEKISELISNMSFLPLYDKKRQLFSIGFNIDENKLTNSYYDLLASEARQTSYLCIARGEVPATHWFNLGRSLTVVDAYKGLVSWSGTMFEYLMPLLIMKSYKNTLLAETYSFVIKSQKKYGRQRNMPWGTSESGFNSVDANLDYQYKAIGVPWLGLKRGLLEDAVAAPYATFLALLVDPEGALQNIKRLKAEGLEGSYGFYEAADYTPERLPFEMKRAIVKSFMAHHQGMSLIALDNYLNSNIMQERFHSDPEIHAARLLLQEKIPVNILFTKENKEKVTPPKEPAHQNTASMRRFTMPDPVLPKAHILTNGNYSLMITDRGTGFSKNKMSAVTRWREDRTLDPYGMFFYLRNVDTDFVWSSTYSPLNVVPEKYEVEFTTDKASYKRTDRQLETKTDVIVATGDNVEIRRITIKNRSEKPCTIEITSYLEVVLATQAADIAHPAFSNLFVETEFLQNKSCLTANRRPRSESDKNPWLAHFVVLEGGTCGNLQYETDRMKFIGRGHNLQNPAAMSGGKALSNSSGPVLDPVMSLRTSTEIAPGKASVISFVTAASESFESLITTLDKFETIDSIEAAYQLALAQSQFEIKYLNLEHTELTLFQDMLSHILFISPLRRESQLSTLPNKKGQSSLWRYGISGDFPIALMVLNKTNSLQVLYEVLKAHEYWRLMDLRVDLVILCDEEYNYSQPLHSLISDIVLSRQTHKILYRPTDVFIIDKNKLLPEDVSLLYAVARVHLKNDGRSMSEQMHFPAAPPLPMIIAPASQPVKFAPPAANEVKLRYFNGLGGFSPNGCEYIIRLNKLSTTPAPWVNVIANKDFGFIVSEQGSGHVWFGNSRENKLTPWSNDAVSDSPGETLYITDRDTGESWTVTAAPIRENGAYTITHGFGYSVFEHFSHGIAHCLTQHVPEHDPVKISLLTLKNTTRHSRNLALTYYIQPVLGVSEQVTSMHIKTSVSESGALIVENPFNEDFPGNICFLDSSIIERSVTGDRNEFFSPGSAASPECLKRETLSGAVGTGYDPCAAIQVQITMIPGESSDIVFLFGAANNAQKAEALIQQYRDVSETKNSRLKVSDFWKGKLELVQVNTPSVSMNLMLNGWLQYQVIACRLWARSGFYQSGGAYGFRDQLQDCLSVAHIWPEITRAQILLHARHQFIEGDVQHWWHEPGGKGIRTRFSDDLLWLPYATCEYIRITGDATILDEQLPFLEYPQLSESEDERYGMPNISAHKATLYKHCTKAINHSLKFGKHGLPLMGSGDWNDGMNTVGNKGLGESIWLGWFQVTILKMFSAVCLEIGDAKQADLYLHTRGQILDAIETSGWDGAWYRRAYFDNGLPLGSSKNKNCQIDSIAQTWALISGAGNRQRAATAMESLEERLIQREEGIIKLLTPPFDNSDLEPGYIKGYVPGIRENGGQYTHAAAWVVIALSELGDGDKAAEMFGLINPINHAKDAPGCAKYKLEPYVISADVYANPMHAGRGGWSWYTGSAGWMQRAGLENILGFQKNGSKLTINPCIPRKWKEYSIQYRYLSSTYLITVKNPNSLCRGVKEILIDGKVSADNSFDLIDDSQMHDVTVILGIPI